MKLLTAIACAVMLTACGADAVSNTTPEQATQSTEVSSESSGTVSYPLVGSLNTFNVESSAATKPVALWFWAPG